MSTALLIQIIAANGWPLLIPKPYIKIHTQRRSKLDKMTDKLSLNSNISLADDLISSDLSETETVMLHINRGAYYGLEGVGKTIWDMIVNPCSVGSICENIVTLYKTDAETVEKDVLEVVTDMLKEELIIVHDDAKTAIDE